MRVWLDDERPMPDSFDWHVTTADGAIALLETGLVTNISLDHDLGHKENGTGYDVACWIEQAAFERRLPRLMWDLHTANPVGMQKMLAALINANTHWDATDVAQ